ncbi:unnamed protein product, partial [Candidula unifasciata]
MMAEIKHEIPKDAMTALMSEAAPLGTTNGTGGIGVKKFKGNKIGCGELRKYLYAVEIYRQASMLRKGREVHKIYVNVHKGVSFLDDRFTLTEFGKMVLENGSVRAGRARNVRQIVVARETLYCSGTGGCRRACGGYGSCVSGCDKIKVRGHKCSFRVKLTMRLGFVDHWFVEILGSHNCYIEDGETPNDVDRMLADYETKSSDGEDSSICSSQRESPLVDAAAALAANQNVTSFFPPNSSHHTSPSVLLASAHCPLNVPLFPESYLMTVARNAAAAIAMSNGTSHTRCQPSPLSLSMKHERSPDMVVHETMNGLLHPSVFRMLPPSTSSTSPPTGDNGCSPHTPTTDAIDLSTPKIKKEEGAQDLKRSSSSSPAEAAFRHSLSPFLNHSHSLSSRSRVNIPACHESDKSSSNGHGQSTNQKNIPGENIPDSFNALSSASPKSVLNSIPATQRFSSSLILPSPNSPSISKNHRYLKGGFRNLKPYVVPNQNVVGSTPSWAELERGFAGEHPDEIKHSRLHIEELDKDLINRVQQLEAHVTQLRNIVLKQDGDNHGHKKQQREFDFTKYNTRHVALKIAYLGWDYHGFVVQEDTDKTIEAALFEALLKTRLIETREASNYHRCGRTDKGVSALGQVISIDLRTNLLSGVGVKQREDGTACTRPGDNTTEIRYVYILNKVLPPEIRVLAWAPVDTEFSARFSCKKRTYKYYFPKGNLDIQKMNEAAAKLVGEHDFRNLCKMDVGNGVVNFTRKILRADVAVFTEVDGGYSMCELTIVGLAFLWHQIRCIVSVLFLVAQGKEDAMIVEELLDVEKNPRKPQYAMAS